MHVVDNCDEREPNRRYPVAQARVSAIQHRPYRAEEGAPVFWKILSICAAWLLDQDWRAIWAAVIGGIILMLFQAFISYGCEL